MTRTEFLQALPRVTQAGYVVYLTHREQIRLRSPQGEEHCPITALCAVLTGRIYHPRRFRQAARDIGLTWGNDLLIVHAADTNRWLLRGLRTSLLEALRPSHGSMPDRMVDVEPAAEGYAHNWDEALRQLLEEEAAATPQDAPQARR